MSNKALVQKKYPKARAWRWAGPRPWVIYAYDGNGTCLSMPCATAAKAWAEARASMRTKS